jgi:hypothetical protein
MMKKMFWDRRLLQNAIFCHPERSEGSHQYRDSSALGLRMTVKNKLGNSPDRQKAQVSLEFSAAFVALIILLLATTKIFVWFGNNIVQRNTAYEGTRTGDTYSLHLPPQDFYNQSAHPLHIFK